jgi:hypothetical protein
VRSDGLNGGDVSTGLMGCYAVCSCKWIPMFRRNILFPSSGLKMEAVSSPKRRCLATSLHGVTARKTSIDRTFHFLSLPTAGDTRRSRATSGDTDTEVHFALTQKQFLCIMQYAVKRLRVLHVHIMKHNPKTTLPVAYSRYDHSP